MQHDVVGSAIGLQLEPEARRALWERSLGGSLEVPVRAEVPGKASCELHVRLLCQEDVILIALLLGVYWMIKRDHWRYGLALSATCAALIAAGLAIIEPRFRSGDNPLLTRYRELGTTFPGIFHTLISRPGWVLTHVVFTPDKLDYDRFALVVSGIGKVIADLVR